MNNLALRWIRLQVIAWGLALGLFVGIANAAVVTDLTGVNVTTGSFMVIWWVDEPATGSLEVFADPDGLLDVTSSLSLSVVSDGDAAARGIVGIRVEGTLPGTEYFVRTTTTPTGGGAIEIEPAATPLLGIRTPNQVERIASDLSPIANDLLTQNLFESDATTPASGSLLLVVADGAIRPLAAFVGTGISSPRALVDLNNFFATGTGDSLRTMGGESLSQLAIGGFTGADAQTAVLASPTGLAAPITIGSDLVLGGLLADSDADGLSDLLDNCPSDPNGFRPGMRAPDGTIQSDQDADGLGDVCDPTPVPEPSGVACWLASVGLLGILFRRRAPSLTV